MVSFFGQGMAVSLSFLARIMDAQNRESLFAAVQPGRSYWPTLLASENSEHVRSYQLGWDQAQSTD
jgi:hypothetical protein